MRDDPDPRVLLARRRGQHRADVRPAVSARSARRVAMRAGELGEKVSAWLAGQLLLGGIIGTHGGHRPVAAGRAVLLRAGADRRHRRAHSRSSDRCSRRFRRSRSRSPCQPATALGVAVFFFLQQQVENHVSCRRSWRARSASARCW